MWFYLCWLSKSLKGEGDVKESDELTAYYYSNYTTIRCPRCGWAMFASDDLFYSTSIEFSPGKRYKVRCDNPECKLFGQLFWAIRPEVILKRAT